MTNIKKTAAVIAAIALAIVSARSQEATQTPDEVIRGFNALDHRLQQGIGNEPFVSEGFGRNWFFTVEGGPSFTHRSEGQLVGTPDLGARFGVTAGSWFNSVHGLKFSLNGGARGEHGGKKYGFAGFGVDYMMNLTRLARPGTTFSPVEFIGTVGAEYQRRFRSAHNSNVFGGHVGLQVRYNVTPSTYIYAEPRFGIFSDNVNTRRSWQRYDWEASVLVGLGYRMSPLAPRRKGELASGSFIDNTFYGFSFGALMPVRRDMTPVKDHLGAIGSLYLGKWASSISGWRVGGTAGFFGMPGKGHPKYASAELDYMFNINSIVNGFDPARRFNANIFFGPAIGLNSHKASKIKIGAAIGAQAVIDLTENLQFVIEPKATVYNRHFANLSSHANVLASLSLGFQYRLGSFKDGLIKYDYASDARDYLGAGNWFLTLSGGMLARQSSFRRNATLSAGFGKWFTPLSAWRLSAHADYFHRQPRYAAGTVSLDYMMSLATLFGGYDSGRVFDLIVSAGAHAGLAHYGGYHWVAGLQGGLQAKFNVSDNIDLFVEPQLLATHSPGYRYSGAANWRLNVGLNYKFGAPRKSASDAGSEPLPLRYFLTANAGPGIFSQGFKSGRVDKVGGGFGLMFGRQFNYVSAVQAGLDFDFVDQKQAKVIAIGTIHVDYVLNLTQLVDRNPDRRFDFSGIIGAGLGWSTVHSSIVGVTGLGGLQYSWHLTDSLDLLAQAKATLWQPRAVNFSHNTNHFVGMAKLTIGAAYRF